MSNVKRQENIPFDRLTVLADKILTSINNDDIKAIVLLTDGKQNGIGISGWEDEVEAIGYMFIHLQAMFRASGKEMRIMTEDGVFMDDGP